MEFGILGPLEARADGEPLALGGGKARALLAVLLLHANEPVSPDAIAVALWGEEAPANAGKPVQMAVSRLRKALGDPGVVTTTPAGYRLRVRPGELDAERFQGLVEEGRAALAVGRVRRAGELLRDALALWRGPPLADLAYEPFAQSEIAALQEQRLAALEARVEADLAAGRGAELVGELQRLVAEHPLRERLHGQLMLALYRTGRQADALEAYRDARATLVEQLGVEPASELRELERAVLAQDPGLMPALQADAPAVQIPAVPTPTFGREAEIARLGALVSDAGVRLVTVVGPGGVGKTRLAAEVGHAVGHRFGDGARFVSLAALTDHEHVATTIGHEVGVTTLAGESAAEALARRLARLELLLVLDNFEHVLDAAPLIAGVLAQAPGVTVLATSREPLRLRAERLWQLDPLAVAPTAAVAMFVFVAQAADPGFALRDRDADAALEVCRRLDGLPLAIELAAGRVAMLTVPELAERLRAGAGALGTAARDAPSRQRTLAATLEWSYRLLTPDERHAFAALAVFAGGCTVSAAQSVTEAPLEVLEALVAKNLVRARRAEDGSRRLDMLATVREFAGARLAERDDADAVRERHCEHYLGLAEATWPELVRSAPPALVDELDRELNNFRAALRWALQQRRAVLAVPLATAVAYRLGMRELDDEAAGWIDAALALDDRDVPPRVRADALERLAVSLARVDTERALSAANESLELRRAAGDAEGCARSLCALAHASLMVHRVADTHRYAAEAERLARESGSEPTLARALGDMAQSAPSLADALELGERAATLWRTAGNRRQLAMLRANLAYTALFHDDHDMAAQLSREALAAEDVTDEPLARAYAHGNAGLAALFGDEVEHARESFASKLELFASEGVDKLLFEPINGLAGVAAERGEDLLAARLCGVADAISSERHDPVIAERLEARFFAPALARLGERAWQAAYDEGAAMSRDEGIELALRQPLRARPTPRG